MRRRISIFGSTGSIGRSTVELIEAQGGAEAFEVVALTGSGNVTRLADQARRLRARRVVTADPARHDTLRSLLADTDIETAAGPEALLEAAELPVDWAMSAIVGAAGLEPGLRLAAHGCVLALANKESMVCAGELFRRTCHDHGTTLVPVDSEPSAIYQALRGEAPAGVERIILTASGGPFRTWSRGRMAAVTPRQARAHPRWSMGERISIDSASLFNKAMEIMEVHELFDVEGSRIEVVVHPQSIVHSMVAFRDGSIIAQLGPPDMRGAIGFALNWPERQPLPVERIDFTRLGRLDFSPVDHKRFPALRLARSALEMGGLAGAVFNAAKEEALDAFLAGAIGFLDMAVLVEHVLSEMESDAAGYGPDYGLDDVTDLDDEARRMSRVWVEAFTGF